MKAVMQFKLLYPILVLALLCMMCPLIPVWLTQGASAAATVSINITATGAEVDISCNQTAWNVGTVGLSDNVATSDAWARITNNTSADVDVTIRGYDMKNAGETRTWTMSDNGTNGAAIFGMAASKSGSGTWAIVIKKNAAYNQIATSLANAATQDFGMCFVAPSATLGNDEMEMVGAGGTPTDSPRGVCLTASL